MCERLQKQGSPHVGEANVFVIWYLETPLDTVLDALRNFLTQKGLQEDDTFFWIADYTVRQTNVKADIESYKGTAIPAVGHSVLVAEPWHDPAPLRRVYGVRDVYDTVANSAESGTKFDMIMSTMQQTSFEKALVDDFDSIQKSLSEVDVRRVRTPLWLGCSPGPWL